MSTTMTGILLALAGAFLVAYLMRRRARLRWLRGSTPPTNPVLSLILKSTALAMSSVSLGCGHIQGDFNGRPHGDAQSGPPCPRAGRASEDRVGPGPPDPPLLDPYKQGLFSPRNHASGGYPFNSDLEAQNPRQLHCVANRVLRVSHATCWVAGRVKWAQFPTQPPGGLMARCLRRRARLESSRRPRSGAGCTCPPPDSRTEAHLLKH